LSYEILPHTADIGLEAKAPSLGEVLAEAARGLAAIVLDAEPPTSERTEPIRVDANDHEDLLVQFLNECLYRYESTGELVVGAQLKSVSPVHAEGDVFVVLEPEAGGPPIKAVTYHGLVLTRAPGGWFARVYLDV
jgi:SHS2 domain-containing protein